MSGSDTEMLCPLLRERFERVGNMLLKGIGNVDVFGFRRSEPVDVPALEQACRQYYVTRS